MSVSRLFEARRQAVLIAVAWSVTGCAVAPSHRVPQSPGLFAAALNAASEEGLAPAAYRAFAEWVGDIYTVSFLRNASRDVGEGFPVHFVVRVSRQGKAVLLKGISEATAVNIAKREAKTLGCGSFVIAGTNYEFEGGSWLVFLRGGATSPVDPQDPQSLTQAGRPSYESLVIWVDADGSTDVSWGR